MSAVLTGDAAAAAIRQGYPHPIAYTYDAAEHCPVCAARAYGVESESGFIPETARDSEGNPIGAVAPWETDEDDALRGLYCDTCGGEISARSLDVVEEDARARGVEDGTAAGSWVLDGNSTEETARAILDGIEDGDPMILDALPSAPLSGEFADGLLPRDVLGWYGMSEDDDAADDVLRAYEDGFSEGVTDEAERSARAMLT